MRPVQAKQISRGLSVLLLGASIFAVGCRKETEPNPTGVATSPADKASAPAAEETKYVQYTYQNSGETMVTPQGEKLAIVRESTIEPRVGELLVTLTMYLRQYMDQKGSAPDSVNQLIASKMDSAPQAPPGTMYVIDAKNKEVRLVKIK